MESVLKGVVILTNKCYWWCWCVRNLIWIPLLSYALCCYPWNLGFRKQVWILQWITHGSVWRGWLWMLVSCGLDWALWIEMWSIDGTDSSLPGSYGLSQCFLLDGVEDAVSFPLSWHCYQREISWVGESCTVNQRGGPYQAGGDERDSTILAVCQHMEYALPVSNHRPNSLCPAQNHLPNTNPHWRPNHTEQLGDSLPWEGQ